MKSSHSIGSGDIPAFVKQRSGAVQKAVKVATMSSWLMGMPSISAL